MQVAEIALRKGYIDKNQLQKALSIVRKGDRRRFELLLYHLRFIDEAQLAELLKDSLARLEGATPVERDLKEDLILASMALQRKWLRRSVVQRILRHELELLSEDTPRRFLEIAFFEGKISLSRKRALEEEFRRCLFVCVSCLQKVSVSRVSPGAKFQCPRCQRVYRRSHWEGGTAMVEGTHVSIDRLAMEDYFHPSQERVLRYESRKKLGQGGIGAIYQLYDRDLQRVVAVKVMRQDKRITPKSVHRFIREARILAQLQHPNIVPVHEIGYTSERVPYFTMKYVRGVALSEVIEEMRRGVKETLEDFHLDRLVDIFRAICQGVAFAHANGVIHRDLKPANIMLGTFGEVLVMDWGLAKLEKEEGEEEVLEDSVYGEMLELEEGRGDLHETAEGAMLGTVHYIPPEQVHNREVDERSDVYSLGAILYEMLTFRPPFLGESKEEIVEQVLHSSPPPIRSVAKRRVPYELEAICRKAMAKDKSERYQSVMELYEDVSNYRSRQPVLAASSSIFRTFILWVQRNRMMFVALVSVFLVMFLLSPILGFALRAVILGLLITVGAGFGLVLYGEARRTIVQLRRQLKAKERAYLEMEARVAKLENRER
ncbi:MAG: serine/threonine protein kinase [Planctomycetota bacterium]|nr:MAG: serine/threonine protein kinase [Planctomycetota bacterium]